MTIVKTRKCELIILTTSTLRYATQLQSIAHYAKRIRMRIE